jgi:hypothetical protein
VTGSISREKKKCVLARPDPSFTFISGMFRIPIKVNVIDFGLY